MQLIVLGFDREGTAAVTRVLNMMGAYVGPEYAMRANHGSSVVGLWERSDVVQLNDFLLEASDASWDRVADFSVTEVSDGVKEEFTRKAERVVAMLDSHRPWVINDTRMSLVFPLWSRLLEVPVCIHVYRHPVETANELRSLEGLPLTVGVALWEKYALSSLQSTSDLPRILVSYTDLVHHPYETVERLYSDLLALEVGGLRMPSRREVLAFLKASRLTERTAVHAPTEYLNNTQQALNDAFQTRRIFALELPQSISEVAREVLKSHEAYQRMARTAKELEEQLRAAQLDGKQQQREVTGAVNRAGESEALQQRVLQLERDLAVAERRVRELGQLRARLESERAQELQQISQWMTQIEQGLGALMSSHSWRLGRRFVTLWRKLTFQPTESTAADHIQHVLSRYATWARKRSVSGGRGAGPERNQRQSTPKKTSVGDGKIGLPDSTDSPDAPRRQPGDGRRVQSVARNQEHVWYTNHAVQEFVESLGPALPVPAGIRRLLVLGHDFALRTGVSRSIYHYLNALATAGGVELTSIELVPGSVAANVYHEVDAADFVIVNSLALFANHDDMVDLVRYAGPHKVAVYLHETEWVLDKFKREEPERFRRFAEAAPDMNFLCVSEQQRQWLRKSFGVQRAQVVYETTTLPHAVTASQAQVELPLGRSLRVVMMGTLQPRKGVTLFSQVADLAKRRGLPWTFHWAGWEVKDSGDMYKSPNVEYVGNLRGEDLYRFLMSADVFFLSSADDPLPLACLEAIQAYKRVVVYRKSGVSELVDGVSGAAVFEHYSADEAFACLQRVATERLDVERYEQINREITSITGFVRRMNTAIADFRGEVTAAGGLTSSLLAPPKLTIAVVLHLYHHDLWNEIAGYLRNFREWAFDLYVTLTNDKDQPSLDKMKSVILRQYPQAHVLTVENRGMDVGPFFAVLNEMMDNGRRYDLILKIHSKKSEAVSGLVAGAQWRQGLLNELLGSQTKIRQIIDLFERFDHIGMIGPKGFLMGMSSSDTAAGRNLNQKYMDEYFERLNLQDRSLEFFRGTMFWIRADLLFNVFRHNRIQPSEFEQGYLPDGSRAHAMERVFANIVRSQGKTLHEFDSTMPRPVSLLKDRHKGADIYVIAAGASCDYLDPSFFDGKIVIGVNRVFKRFRCDYVVCKETPGRESEELMLEQGIIPVVSKWDSGDIKKGKRRLNVHVFSHPNCFFFDHLENEHEKVDLSVIGTDDKLVVSYSTITSAIHLAAFMGAKNIILVGHDCGLVDGKAAYTGYYTDLQKETPWQNWDEYQKWLAVIEGQTLKVKERVGQVYGCNVYSLNPFINFGLEGHTYRRPDRT